MSVDLGMIIGILYAIVAVMIIIVLYHVLFIVVDIRKMSRRVEDMTEQVESVLLKPLSIADQAFQWMLDAIERKKSKKKSKHEHHAHGDA